MKKDSIDRNRRIHLPDLFSDPPGEPRRLHDSGMSYEEVAQALHCDRRTAAKLVRNNLDTKDIGKWSSAHKKLTGYTGIINSFTDTKISKYSSLLSFSQDLYRILRKEGYTGSERTLRNYLSSQKKVKLYFDALRQKGAKHVENNKHK